MLLSNDLVLREIRPGDLISIPRLKSTHGGKIVAAVRPGLYKSTLSVSFKGGLHYPSVHVFTACIKYEEADNLRTFTKVNDEP